MKWVNNKFKKLANKISRFFRGIFTVGATFLGIKRTDTGRYDLKQLYIAGSVTLFLIPIGMLIFQTSFSLGALISIVLTLLCLVNLDRALMLVSLFAEQGVDEILSIYFEPYINGEEPEFHN